MHVRTLFAALILSAATVAEGGGTAVSDADLTTYVKLMEAKALGDARAVYARAPRPKRSAELEQALKDAGWTPERFSGVAGVVEEIAGALDNIKSDPENAESYRQQLADEQDPATVARVRARRAELDEDAARKRAEQAVRDERKEAATGRPVTAAALQGTWTFDLEASLAHVQQTMMLPESAMAPMRTALEKNRGTTYAFAGSTVEVRGSPSGDGKATFRVDGKDLVIADGKREHRLQAGMKGSDLVLSMMGVGTIYRKR